MNRSDVEEFHYIARFENVSSILEHGIFCRRRAGRLAPVDVANHDVLNRRKEKRVPGGAGLLEYVNVYFDARNAMLSDLRDQWNEVAIVRVRPDILDIAGAVIADRNAAAGAARFYPAPAGLAALDPEVVFAEWWNHSREAKQQRMAELLVPGAVPADLLTGCYVRDNDCASRLQAQGVTENVTVNGYLYLGRRQ